MASDRSLREARVRSAAPAHGRLGATPTARLSDLRRAPPEKPDRGGQKQQKVVIQEVEGDQEHGGHHHRGPSVAGGRGTEGKPDGGEAKQGAGKLDRGGQTRRQSQDPDGKVRRGRER